ncbi:MAG: MotA/TolQ/ExbB proton channel family protein [Rickettsiales bacterium]|nr:MotA/TolQ/ExbB proton channel family protein [Rickettsiales bacterium]
MSFFNILEMGGIMMIPLSLLFIMSVAVIIDKVIFYHKFGNLSKNIRDLVETYDFSWDQLSSNLSEIPDQNIFKSFFNVIIKNKSSPSWWVESRAEDEAKLIEENISKNIWIVETTVTAAPLIGLLGTIIGMMGSFRLFGVDNLVNVSGITGGVAEALVVTAVGLGIALIALFAFNYLSKKQDRVLDEMERLGTKMIDHIRLEDENKKK